MKKICKIQFGSHLYGTATETSDVDWKGIFVPETRDILLGRIPKTADKTFNTGKGGKIGAGEQDGQWISLHHFIKLACDGQTMALDMLYAPESAVLEKGEYYTIWELLQNHRERFLSKQMNAFQGYARAQAAKYSLKGKRLVKLRAFERILEQAAGESGDTPLVDIWGIIPMDDERENAQGVLEMQIAGKWYGATTRTGLVLASVRNQMSKYGGRANDAAEEGGIDWKALSHAVRVSNELYELIVDRRIVFPLGYARLLKLIKAGKVRLNVVQELIDIQLEENEKLMAASDLPDRVDRVWWDNWLFEMMLTTTDDDICKIRTRQTYG
jgi:hypothetical protein